MNLIPDHFHVHIVNVNFEGGMLGMTVGQAHLLDDVISLVSDSFTLTRMPLIFLMKLQLDSLNCPGIFQNMTLTYGLGDQHGLYENLRQCCTAEEI